MARPTLVVAEALDPLQADIWLRALREAGIEAASFERGVGAALGGAVTAGSARYPIVVAEADIGAARSVIADLSGASAIAPVRARADVRASQRRALLTVAAVVVGIVILGVLSRIVAG
jgi:hypothetical protein